jgi:hypothetical protein
MNKDTLSLLSSFLHVHTNHYPDSYISGEISLTISVSSEEEPLLCIPFGESPFPDHIPWYYKWNEVQK